MLLDSLVPQADTRSSAVYVDQHGRKWDVTLDNRARPRPSPVSEPSPLDWKFRIPKYLRPDPTWMTFNDLARTITIDYELALSKQAAAHKYYHKERMKAAQRLYGDAAGDYVDYAEVDQTTGVTRMVRGKMTPLLYMELGPQPKAIEFVKAMRADNSWALGFSTVVPDWAKPLLPYEPSVLKLDDGIDYAAAPTIQERAAAAVPAPRLTWNEFRSQKKAEGLNTEDISHEWALYKDEALEEVPIG